MGFIKYAYYLVGIVFLLHTQFSESDAYINVFLVKRDGEKIHLYKEDTFCDLTAAFGPSIPGGDSEHGGLLGYTKYANPHNACLPIDPAPIGSNHTHFIAVISRTGDSCPFERKIYNAQAAGFKAAIVHNVGSEDLVKMESSDIGLEITIPSVFVGYLDGIALGKQYNYDGGHGSYVIRLDNGVCMDLNLKKYLLPFAITVGVCFFLMLTYMCVKWIQDVRKRRRGRLSTRHLKKIPIQKFKKGDKYDTCAICLDEYEDGEKLRVLPCQHAYHVKCVDPWLLNRKRTCPVCKRKVYPGKERARESDSSDEDNSQTEDEERQPLLSAQMYIQQERRQMLQSSFDRSGLPGALRSEVSSIPSSYGTADTDSLAKTSRARPSTMSAHSNYSSSSDSNNSTIGVHEPGHVDVHDTQHNRSTGSSNPTDLEEIGAVGGHPTVNLPVEVKVVSKSDEINELLAKTI